MVHPFQPHISPSYDPHNVIQYTSTVGYLIAHVNSVYNEPEHSVGPWAVLE